MVISRHNMNFPEMIRVRQQFDPMVVKDISRTVAEKIDHLDISKKYRPGNTVALACSSRGIANYQSIVRSTAASLVKAGLKPFIIPAMGSHGSATAEGQKQVLEDYGITESQVVDDALAAFFSGEHEVKRDAALIRRLDRMTRASEVLKRNQVIAGEAFALFMRYFLTVIPPVPEADKQAAKAQGNARFERYLQSLQRILQDGESILFTALEDMMAEESAFFTKGYDAVFDRPLVQNFFAKFRNILARNT